MSAEPRVTGDLWAALIVPPAAWSLYVLVAWTLAERDCGAGPLLHGLSAACLAAAAAGAGLALRHVVRGGPSGDTARLVATVSAFVGAILTVALAVAWLLLSQGAMCA